VRDLQSSVVLDTIKRTTRIPLGHLQLDRAADSFAVTSLDRLHRTVAGETR